jgi:hypothetical protein
MRSLILVFILFAALSLTPSHAQLFSKKMPVGVKTYSYFDPISKFENEFKDFNGSLDKYNFYSLDTDLQDQEICTVYDRKLKLWRLPLSQNEAMGIAEKDGDEPLARSFVAMGLISPAIREKIE